MAALLAFVLGIGSVVLQSVFRGFVLSYLWSWFVVPFGLPEIGVVHAMGVSLIVAFLTYEGFGEKSSEEGLTSMGINVVQFIIALCIVLCVGWIYHQIMM